MDGNKKPTLGNHEVVTINHLSEWCLSHSDPKIDLVVINIGPILKRAANEGKYFYFSHIDNSMLVDEMLLGCLNTMESIVMIGYPNAIWDSTNNLPIIRKGITATHPQRCFNGQPEFLIDAACFPGSSGSPVFLRRIDTCVDHTGKHIKVTRIALLGTLYAGMEHITTGEVIFKDTTSISLANIPNSLGLVIQASALLALERSISEGALNKIAESTRNSVCKCGSLKRYKSCCGALK